MIRVVVTGAAGKMGQQLCRAVKADGELELVAAVDINASEKISQELGISITSNLAEVLKTCKGEVLVDFTRADAVIPNVRTATEAGLHAVIGTTGLASEEIEELKMMAQKSGKNILLAPNFALGAVILMMLSQKIAGFFDRVEIIELHHDQKADAPSGTSIATAEMIAKELKPVPLKSEEKYPGVRGGKVKGIPIHSVRLPGLVAHQEVIFGLQGQILTLRHDSFDRSSFIPGVLKAVKEISQHPGFTYGLDKFIGL